MSLNYGSAREQRTMTWMQPVSALFEDDDYDGKGSPRLPHFDQRVREIRFMNEKVDGIGTPCSHGISEVDTLKQDGTLRSISLWPYWRVEVEAMIDLCDQCGEPVWEPCEVYDRLEEEDKTTCKRCAEWLDD